jgi:uncharacterized protein YjiS (DUF1127 family)
MNAVFHGSSAIPASGTRSGYAIRRSPGGGAVVGGAAALLRFLDNGLDHLVERLFTWQRRIADRRSLEALDDRMLRDIGITRAEVHHEVSKPFWKP